MKTRIAKLILASVMTIISATALNSVAHAYTFQGRSGTDCGGFLGLTSWDCGVTISNDQDLKTGAVLIAANVLIDITVIAAYLVLGYTIYGGYLYTFSAGDPGKVATAKKALYHAFLGLAIVMSANVIMNSIRIAMLGANGSFAKNCLKSSCVGASNLITNAVQWVIGIAGAVSAIFIVYGGITYITSSGDAGKLDKGKKMITYALIGLLIVALAEIIVAFVSNTITESTAVSEETSFIINSKINNNIDKGVL